MKGNHEEKLRKAEIILSKWQNKILTLTGKIAVIKVFASAQLVYVNVFNDFVPEVFKGSK